MVYDVAIVGGGILGLSTAFALSEAFPHARVLLLEKEDGCARHQSGHNSGVIHSGIYYRPGSRKAEFAPCGNRELVRFCSERGIPFDICGKVIVATELQELPRLEALYQRGCSNGLSLEKVGPEQLREIEPSASGIAAIRVPTAGIVDFRRVADELASILVKRGAQLCLGTEVEAIEADASGLVLSTSRESVRARFLVNCAGLQSDRLARRMGVATPVKIVPFRGEYYELVPAKRSLVRALIYPVPDPRFPFLGVHLTRGIAGTVHAGPNAVIAFKREGYRKSDFALRDVVETLTYRGFWRLAGRHWREGLEEVLRSASKKRFLRSLQRLVPDLQDEDLVRGGVGVRAQALRRDGQLFDDFLLLSGPRSIHVCNAPSPAATACFPIGRAIAARVPDHVLN